MRESLILFLAVALITSGLAETALAQSKRWSIRAFGAAAFSRGQSATAIVTDGMSGPPAGEVQSVTYDVGNGGGLGIGIEYRVVEHIIGIEVGIQGMQLDSDFTLFTDSTTVSEQNPLGKMYPLTVSGNFHLLGPDKKSDFYIAPVIAWIIYDENSENFTQVQSVTFDNDFGIGFDLGFNYQLNSGPWMITSVARFISLQSSVAATLNNGDTALPTTVNVDPFILGVGVGLRL